MRIWKQAAMSLVVLGAAAWFWARDFPVAAALFERAGVATASVGAPSTPTTSGSPGAGGGRASAPRVIGVAIETATINASVSAIGDGRAARSVTVTPYAEGRVVTVDVGSGDFVLKGTPLVHLDADAEEIAVDRARLTLEDARATLERDRTLVSSNAKSAVELTEATLAVGQAELEVRDAELALERRVVRAPFDGWVGILSVDLGDRVDTGTAIATLDDRSHILVDFRVPERFVGQVKVGAPVSARPLADPARALDGEVVTLDSRVAEDTRTLRVRASLDNADDTLRAGMAFAITMRFPGETFPAVDPLAIQWSADGAYVWTGADGKAKRVPVRIVQRDSDQVLVDADLAPGTPVVTEGVQMLRAGAPFVFEGGGPAPDPAAEGGASGPTHPPSRT
ncbi:MAG: efflux RND transporter periplasmic adaptor subunit [Amaricoccus sp.]